MPSPPMLDPAMMMPASIAPWDFYSTPEWPRASTSSMIYPSTPPNTSTHICFYPGFSAFTEADNTFGFSLPQPSPASVYSAPGFLEAGAVQPAPMASPALTQSFTGYESDNGVNMYLNRFDTASRFGKGSLVLDNASERSYGIPTSLPTPDFPQMTISNQMVEFSTFS
jgi:hypothetical protein